MAGITLIPLHYICIQTVQVLCKPLGEVSRYNVSLRDVASPWLELFCPQLAPTGGSIHFHTMTLDYWAHHDLTWQNFPIDGLVVMSERGMIKLGVSPFSKDAFWMWMLGAWAKWCESRPELWEERGDDREDFWKTTPGCILLQVLKETQLRDGFSGIKVTDCNDEEAMKLKMNHHYCSSGDGFLSLRWW